MNKEQVLILAKRIKAIYPYVIVDKAFLELWHITTRKADFNRTMNRFYQYISDQKNSKNPPVPGDIVVNIEANPAVDQFKKMRRWEEEVNAERQRKLGS